MISTDNPQGRWSRSLRPTLLACLLVAVIAACNTGPGGPPPPPPEDDAVADTLDALGVDTSPSARLAPDGSTLDEDSAPLGGAATFGEPDAFSSESGANPTMELVMSRNFFASDTLVVEEIVGAGVTPGGDIDLGDEAVLVDLSAGNDWITPVYGDENQFQSLRDITAGESPGRRSRAPRRGVVGTGSDRLRLGYPGAALSRRLDASAAR